MNTKLLMTGSAVVMGVAGVALSFMPAEIAQYLMTMNMIVPDPLILQLLGALYFAFAMINWTSKANLIGGIYSRPIAIGNFTHFGIGALALIKGYSSTHLVMLIPITIVYGIFAVSFGIVFFTHPVKDKAG